jgi:outer membrane protein OmpA-like peptidoglycan-associated protein
MTDQSAPKGVHLLKELLFERETRRLDDLGRRQERDAAAATQQYSVLAEQQAVQARLQAEQARLQKDLDERLTAVFARAGTAEKLQHSVAEIIDGALREAEVERHEQLSRAVAPLVVRTIKNQLKESQDEMVDALYPITGRLVQSYVQSAVNEMMQKINAKLGGGGSELIKAQSNATGLPAGELALAEANQLEVEELFLVRRASGELVSHWERPEVAARRKATATNDQGRASGDSRDQLFSGYLSGIMSLSEEAFGATPGSFRTLTLENGDRIFVRGSPAHLLAVRCSGSGGPAIERIVDEVFLEMIKRYQAVLAADAEADAADQQASAQSVPAVVKADTDGKVDRLLPEMSRTIEVLTAERRAALLTEQTKAAEAAAALRGPSFGRVYALAAILAAPFIAWGLWSLWQTLQTTWAEAGVQRALADTDEIRGVPPRVEVERGGRALTISGFVPTGALRDQILARLAREVPQARVRDQLGVMPASAGPVEIAMAELKQQIERDRRRAELAILARPITHAQGRMGELRAGHARIAQLVEGSERDVVQAAARVIDDADRDIGRAKAIVDDGAHIAQDLPAPLEAAWTKLRQVETQLTGLIGPIGANARAATPPTALDLLADDTALSTERLAAVQISVAQALALRAGQRRAVSPREGFEALVRSSAVFFENGTDFRDAAHATAALDLLAEGMRGLPDVVLRVVGYTDEKGTQALNSGLAQARADRVTQALVERGLPNNRLVAVGRMAGKDLSRAVGVGSANRRVEFEIGFAGEAAPSP